MEVDSETPIGASDIFEIPPDIIFPMELSRHLKNKLGAAMDENWHLKQHIQFQQQELSQLQKLKMEREEIKPESSQSLYAMELVKVNKKNRDMTAKMESMKTKMQQVMDENEKLKDKIQDLGRINNVETETDNQSFGVSSSTIVSSQRSHEEIISSAHELSVVNNKMMEYRRQCQQLRIELSTALRALAQEIGDGATAKTVLNTIKNSTWRGRQQQILALTQKLADIQIKMKQSSQPQEQCIVGPGGEGSNYSNYNESEHSIMREPSEISYSDFKTFSICSNVSASPSQRYLNGLQQQEKKKHETLEKVTLDLQTSQNELKALQLDIKASKARNTTLECQIKTYRFQVDDLQSKLKNQQSELDSNITELIINKQEFGVLKERERNLREKSSTEIREMQQALTRERAVIVRLQNVIEKEQESVETLENEISRLQTNLDSCCTPDLGRSERRITTLENQLKGAAATINELEKERQRFTVVMAESIDRVEEERLLHLNSERKLVKAIAALQQADSCINDCLDTAQITSTNILKEVESIRSHIRELKTGSLFSLESIHTEDVRKLKNHISVMVKDISILQHHLKNSTDQRRVDLQQFTILADKMREELLSVLQTAVNSFRVRTS